MFSSPDEYLEYSTVFFGLSLSNSFHSQMFNSLNSVLSSYSKKAIRVPKPSEYFSFFPDLRVMLCIGRALY